MNFSSIPILATALSILIAWALFSMLCSYLQEAVAQIYAERGKFLKKYLLKQLDDKLNHINWGEQLYKEGAVDLLIRSVDKPTNEIDATLFAKSVIGAFIKSIPVTTGRAANTVLHPVVNNLDEFKAGLAVVKQSEVVSLFKQAYDDAELKSIVNGVVDQSRLYRELLKNLENWYSQFEARVSLWYKKNTRQRLFFLGLVLAIVINVDSVQLFKFFNTDVAARNAVISFYERNQYKPDTTVKAVNAEAARAQTLALTKQLNSVAKAAALPVGIEESIFYKGIPEERFYMSLFEKIAGLLITGFAVSFGAPFWFDAVRKIYQVKK
jgi:hypothetical protein